MPTQKPLHSGTCLWPAALIVWGPGSAPGRHAHHCAQIVVALTGTLRVRAQARSPWKRCEAVVAAPDARHEIDASRAFVAIAFIGGHSAERRRERASPAARRHRAGPRDGAMA